MSTTDRKLAKWFFCSCGSERLVKSRYFNTNAYQPVIFRRGRRPALGGVYSLPAQESDSGYVGYRFKLSGYYCLACFKFWGRTLEEVKENRQRHDRQKYDDAVADWHLADELRGCNK